MSDSAVEVNVSIICACMPACAHYFRRHGDSLRSLSSRFRIRIKSFYSIFSRNSSSDVKMRANSDEMEDDKLNLTSQGSRRRDLGLV